MICSESCRLQADGAVALPTATSSKGLTSRQESVEEVFSASKVGPFATIIRVVEEEGLRKVWGRVEHLKPGVSRSFAVDDLELNKWGHSRCHAHLAL